MANDVDKEEAVQCPFCKLNFSSALAKKWHDCDRGGDGYFCNLCDLFFASVKPYNTHVRKVHLTKNLKTFDCPKCQRKIQSKHYLKKHLLLEHSGLIKLLECHLCAYQTKYPRYLKRHLQKVHREADDPSVCDVCGKEFKFNWALKRHVEMQHLREKPPMKVIEMVTCEECGKEMPKRKIYGHKKWHHNKKGKTHLCSICGKAFVTKTHLRSHHLSLHSDEWPHECKICGRKFKQKNTLNQHVDHTHLKVPRKPKVRN